VQNKNGQRFFVCFYGKVASVGDVCPFGSERMLGSGKKRKGREGKFSLYATEEREGRRGGRGAIATAEVAARRNFYKIE